MTPEEAAALRAPFPDGMVSKLPKGTCKACTNARGACEKPNHVMVWNCPDCKGNHSSATVHLDYVGHADVTDRLLSVDPMWDWQPVATDERGLPATADGGLWIRLTVCGVTRLGFGDAMGKTGPSATKELIGDAIRNAAMRFGVALDLWSRSDRATTNIETPAGRPMRELSARLQAATTEEALRALWEEAQDGTEEDRHAVSNYVQQWRARQVEKVERDATVAAQDSVPAQTDQEAADEVRAQIAAAIDQEEKAGNVAELRKLMSECNQDGEKGLRDLARAALVRVQERAAAARGQR